MAVGRAVAVAVAVVAQEAVAAGGGPLDRRVDHRQRGEDVGVVGLEQAQAGVLEEAGVDDRALVERRAAVADVVAVAALGSPFFERRMKYGSVLSGPLVVSVQLLEVALELVGDGAPHARRVMVAVLVGDDRRRDEARDLGRDGRGREAALLLPALRAERGAVAGHEVRGRRDVRLVVGCR